MENALRIIMTGTRSRILGKWLSAMLLTSVPVLANTGTGTQVLAPVPRHEKIGQLVTEFVQKSHYRHEAVDDALSSKVLDRYI